MRKAQARAHLIEQLAIRCAEGLKRGGKAGGIGRESCCAREGRGVLQRRGNVLGHHVGDLFAFAQVFGRERAHIVEFGREQARKDGRGEGLTHDAPPANA